MRLVARGLLLWLAAFLPLTSLAAAKEELPPNIVLIVADDLGYGGIGCYGEKEIATPNIDSLAANGVRCTQGYVTCPVCSPTRAGLLTGRYQQRFGHEFNPGPRAPAEFGLPVSEKTLADRLKAQGYATGMVGKWHLGSRPKFHPLDRGFERFFGFLGGAHSYVNPKADETNLVLDGREPIDEKEYLTQAFTREAGAFIDQRQAKPFFLYLTYNAVHAPMHAPAGGEERFATIKEPRRRKHAAMLAALDEGVGKVMQKIRLAGLEERTLIVFISDNGGPTAVNTSSNGPLGGVKGQVREGGVRVPFMAQWKGKLPAGKVFEQPVSSIDIVPTVLAATGGKLGEKEKLDGVNLLPHWRGENKSPPHETLYWRFGVAQAVRHGDWKWIRIGERSPQLYNLADDIGETRDVAAQRPEVVKQLDELYAKWNAELARPAWKGQAPPKQAAKKQNKRQPKLAEIAPAE